MMGIIRDFDLDGLRQAMFVLDGFRRAGEPLICYRDPCDRDPSLNWDPCD